MTPSEEEGEDESEASGDEREGAWGRPPEGWALRKAVSFERSASSSPSFVSGLARVYAWVTVYSHESCSCCAAV